MPNREPVPADNSDEAFFKIANQLYTEQHVTDPDIVMGLLEEKGKLGESQIPFEEQIDPTKEIDLVPITIDETPTNMTELWMAIEKYRTSKNIPDDYMDSLYSGFAQLMGRVEQEGEGVVMADINASEYENAGGERELLLPIDPKQS